MNVEELAAAVRPRAPWEATDLGIVMVRHWWRRIYGPWLLLYLGLTLFLLFPAQHNPLWIVLGVWLAKPALDRVVLFVLSRALFGAATSPSEALRAFLKMAFSWRALFEVTLMRPRPHRALILPVDMLEGGSYESSRLRKHAITRELFPVSLCVSSLFLLFEAIAILGAFGLYFLVFPERAETINAFGMPPETLASIAYVLAVAVLEPFYVGVNFSLYLNQRTKLEFWDLKIAFQQIRARWDKSRFRSVVAQSALLALCLLGAPNLLRAQDTETSPESSSFEAVSDPLPTSQKPRAAWEYREEAKRILKEEPFNQRHQTEYRWVPRWKPKRSELPQVSLSGMAGLTKILFYGLALLGIGSVVFFIFRALFRASDPVPGDAPIVPEARPQPSFHAIIDKETLPRDILRAAREHYTRGDLRKALSFLFRGALVRLADNGSLQLTEFATEGECIRAVRGNLGGELSVFFADLVLAWQKVAYGHRSLEPSHFETLCRDWDKHLGVRR